MNKKVLAFYCLFFLTVTSVIAQKKIVILGSSTAAGNGATVLDSSWVGRLQASFRKNTNDGVDTIVDNRAVAGYVTYQSLPTGYTPPANRPFPDPNHNVTSILNDVSRADIVIISYPTNDIVSGYNPKEVMDNLRLMFQQLSSYGIHCFIATSQPRNNSTNDSIRSILRHLVDSINNNFSYYAINFWDDLVTNDGTNMLRSDLTSDGTHPNNTGHRFLFQRVLAKNIFAVNASAPLPLVLKNFILQQNNQAIIIRWQTELEELNTVFEIERSSDGIKFDKITSVNALGKSKASYLWNDLHPFSGKNYYRLRIIEPMKTTYSQVALINNPKQFFISKLLVNSNKLIVEINSSKNQPAEVSVLNFNGVVIEKEYIQLARRITFSIPVNNLPLSEYFLRIVAKDGNSDVQKFSSLK